MNISVSSKYLSEIPTITIYNSGYSYEILKKVQNEKYQKIIISPQQYTALCWASEHSPTQLSNESDLVWD